MTGSGILWRRLDLPGHDSARLTTGDAVEIAGMTVFRDSEDTALRYTVRCDGSWRTRDASVAGWVGSRPVSLDLRRDDDGAWLLNGEAADSVRGCVDIDLNFTPATNLLPLRRLRFALGEQVEVRAAWLQWPEARLLPLVQRYCRRSHTTYDYEADLPGNQRFLARLEVADSGWVVKYGDLWRAERA